MLKFLDIVPIKLRFFQYHIMAVQTIRKTIAPPGVWVMAPLTRITESGCIYQEMTFVCGQYTLLFRMLRKMRHDVISEFEITGMGVGDIFDLTTGVQYEVERVSYSKFVERRKGDYERVSAQI